MGVPYHANSLHQLHRTGVLRHSTALTDACPREVVVEQCLFLPRHCTEMHPDIPHGIQIFFFTLHAFSRIGCQLLAKPCTAFSRGEANTARGKEAGRRGEGGVAHPGPGTSQ